MLNARRGRGKGQKIKAALKDKDIYNKGRYIREDKY